MLTPPPGNRRIVGLGQHLLTRPPARASVRALLDHAAESDRIDHLRPLEFPRMAHGEPVLDVLRLPAVPEALAEKPVLVADAIAEGGDADPRQAFEETGGEPAQAAVAQRGVGLALEHLVEIHAERGECCPTWLSDAEI